MPLEESDIEEASSTHKGLSKVFLLNPLNCIVSYYGSPLQTFLNYILTFLDAGLGGGVLISPGKGPIDKALFRVSLRVLSPSLAKCQTS